MKKVTSLNQHSVAANTEPAYGDVSCPIEELSNADLTKVAGGVVRVETPEPYLLVPPRPLRPTTRVRQVPLRPTISSRPR
ncbi:MAG: hypothetical protein KME64_40895 [Scytonematopsis contorta HA4267-MV1]|jgi:hypothetical protein|nr:hypothetical protein [Scytonematopsis contorta HA4267-MV1]